MQTFDQWWNAAVCRWLSEKAIAEAAWNAGVKADRDEHTALREGLQELRAQFSDLAVEMEKHSNDHIRDNALGAAVEGVCADRIKAILAASGRHGSSKCCTRDTRKR